MHPYSGTTDGILLWLVLPAGIPVTPLEPLRFFTNGPQGIQHSNQYNSSYRVHTDCFSSFLVFHQGRSSPPHYASVPDSTGTQTSRSSSSNLVLDCCIYFYLDTIVSIVSIVTYRIQSPSRHRSISLSRIPLQLSIASSGDWTWIPSLSTGILTQKIGKVGSYLLGNVRLLWNSLKFCKAHARLPASRTFWFYKTLAVFHWPYSSGDYFPSNPMLSGVIPLYWGVGESLGFLYTVVHLIERWNGTWSVVDLPMRVSDGFWGRDVSVVSSSVVLLGGNMDSSSIAPRSCHLSFVAWDKSFYFDFLCFHGYLWLLR